jgi:hypothetical protein
VKQLTNPSCALTIKPAFPCFSKVTKHHIKAGLNIVTQKRLVLALANTAVRHQLPAFPWLGKLYPLIGDALFTLRPGG